MRVLITGGCGFLGSNIAARLIKDGVKVCIVSNPVRAGSIKNLEWLRSLGSFDYHQADIADRELVSELVKSVRPTCIFHLAGQVAVTVSQQDPVRDFQTNAVGTINLLEAVRTFVPESGFVFSSTNKVYGDLEDVLCEERPTRYVAPDYPTGFSEKRHIDLKTPYGCSKGIADQYVLEYARSYGVNGVSLRHSSMFGPRQFATIDQGWIGWFIGQAMKIKGRGLINICGNGKQVRDVLYVDDVVDCYLGVERAIEKIAGNAYNIGGGMENSVSILELFQILEEELGVKIDVERGEPRPSDQKIFVSDNSKAFRDFGWFPKVGKREGVQKMIRWLCSEKFRKVVHA